VPAERRFGFWCAHCGQTCCWHCRRPFRDPQGVDIKTIGSMFCSRLQCAREEIQIVWGGDASRMIESRLKEAERATWECDHDPTV